MTRAAGREKPPCVEEKCLGGQHFGRKFKTAQKQCAGEEKRLITVKRSRVMPATRTAPAGGKDAAAFREGERRRAIGR